MMTAICYSKVQTQYYVTTYEKQQIKIKFIKAAILPKKKL